MENMEENQGLKLVNDASRSNDIPNDDEKTSNDDDNNNPVIEDNNKPEDIQVKNDDESIAFKLQFDEILIATKLLENAKSNNNNRYYNSYARTSSLSSLNNRRISEIENSYFAHQKSYSHQSSKYHNNYNHNQAKHKRNSSVPKLNLNGISNNSYYPTTTSRNIKMNSLSSTPYIGYDAFDELSFDDAFGLKTSLKEFDYKFNNNRNDSDWDSLSNSQGYPPLTPSSIHSSSSSYSPSLSPYYPSTSTKSSYNQHHHWFLDDKEFLAQQLLLEEERKLLEIQQIQLNDAIAVHQLRLKSEASNNNNNFDPLFKFNLVQTPTTPTAPLTPSMPSSLNNNNSRYKLNSFLHHKSSSSSSQSFNHFSSSSSSSPSSSFPSLQSRYYKEPIGTPVRKPSPSNSNNNHKHNVKPISISTASSLSPSTSTSTSTSTSSSSSPSSSSSSFSLFSKSPSLSINTSNINVNVNLSPTTTSSMPVTPTTPHNNNNNNSYFNPFASLNILNSRPKTINNNLNNKHHHNLFYNSSVSATIFDEREEDLLLWSDESFNKGFEKPLQLDNNNLKFHRGHHRHSSELIKLLV